MVPDLSVIIPTYKRDESLKNLIINLKKQIGLSLEIIVVDQNKDDFFNESLRDLLLSVKHIKLVNPNASKARNIGFSHASSNLVLFIDDDLVPDFDFCMKGVAVFQNYMEIDCFVPLVYSDLGIPFSVNDIKKKKKSIHPENKSLISISDTISAAVFFRSIAFKNTGGFDEFLFDYAGTAEDQEFFLRIFQKGITLWCIMNIPIFHDEKIEGGCELRTSDYWRTREKCIKSWVFRYRIHSSNLSGLSLKSIFLICRSTFLNKEVLLSGFKNVIRQIQILISVIRENKIYLEDKQNFYKQNDYTFLKK